MLEYEDSDLEEIISALLRLQELKIQHEYELAGDTILMTFSFEKMQDAAEKRDQEIERIKAETEKELRKYKSKN